MNSLLIKDPFVFVLISLYNEVIIEAALAFYLEGAYSTAVHPAIRHKFTL